MKAMDWDVLFLYYGVWRILCELKLTPSDVVLLLLHPTVNNTPA